MKKITKIKTNYYSKEILKYLLLAGTIYIAAASPYFIINLIKNINKFKSHKKKPLGSAFDYLKRKGLIEIQKDGHDLCIILTEEGKKRAGKYQIDDLEIARPKKWDRKWRVIIFDIPHLKNAQRNAFRRKLKELGFCSLQKSVWLHPFDCKGEIEILRDFFGLNKNQIQILLVERIENEKTIKSFFKL
ncbi:MAG: hypothetical protein ABIG08_03590 [bacterium]